MPWLRRRQPSSQQSVRIGAEDGGAMAERATPLQLLPAPQLRLCGQGRRSTPAGWRLGRTSAGVAVMRLKRCATAGTGAEAEAETFGVGVGEEEARRTVSLPPTKPQRRRRRPPSWLRGCPPRLLPIRRMPRPLPTRPPPPPPPIRRLDRRRPARQTPSSSPMLPQPRCSTSRSCCPSSSGCDSNTL